MTANNLIFSKYNALVLSILTIITFSIAMASPPIAGAYCRKDCIEYPYFDIIDRFPRDYYWMFPAILLTMTYMVWTYTLHARADLSRKLFSNISIGFAISASVILILNYFVQINVIQASLLNGEKEAIPLWTQYNENGLFIAFEEIGYLFMSIGFLFSAFSFSKAIKQERRIQIILILSCVLSLISLLYICISFGHLKGYLFEVVIISINWLTLIICGFLSMRLFKKE